MSEYHDPTNLSKVQYLVVDDETRKTALDRQEMLPSDINERIKQLLEEISEIDPNIEEVCVWILEIMEAKQDGLDPYYFDGLIAAYQVLNGQLDIADEDPILLDRQIVTVNIIRIDMDFEDSDDQPFFLSKCIDMIKEENPQFITFIGACLSREEYKNNVLFQSQFMQGALTMARIMYAHIAARMHGEVSISNRN